ncbi:hypothetical protein NE237_020408 [Protea cynaroides]|uniref:Cyclin C-terminal domain-containing protein n=1 Tax=Protea cynaroides TaxID=273540 RepID=A0A9Q0K3V2_9MAGN|nr:hypothetical protein NE237_020408 [Protea cynaroides]
MKRTETSIRQQRRKRKIGAVAYKKKLRSKIPRRKRFQISPILSGSSNLLFSHNKPDFSAFAETSSSSSCFPDEISWISIGYEQLKKKPRSFRRKRKFEEKERSEVVLGVDDRSFRQLEEISEEEFRRRSAKVFPCGEHCIQQLRSSGYGMAGAGGPRLPMFLAHDAQLLMELHCVYRFYLKAAKADAEVEKRAKHLAVLSMLDHRHLCFWPSTVAAGLVTLASLAGNHDSSCQWVMEERCDQFFEESKQHMEVHGCMFDSACSLLPIYKYYVELKAFIPPGKLLEGAREILFDCCIFGGESSSSLANFSMTGSTRLGHYIQPKVFKIQPVQLLDHHHGILLEMLLLLLIICQLATLQALLLSQ